METRKMKLALSAGAVALSLALAGCGGGGSSGTPSGPTQADLDKANADAAAAEQAKAAAEKEANEAKAELSAAEKAARAEMAKMLFPIIQVADKGSDGTNSVTIAAQKGPAIHPATVGNARVTLKAVKDSEAMLGSWNGMDYSHTASDKATIMARVYNNEADATMKPIGDVYDGAGDTAAGIDSVSNGVYTLVKTPNMPNARLEADAFPEKDEGTITYPADTDKRSFDGMFQGAPGKYKCTDGTCMATWMTGGVQLAGTGTWTFNPNDGAQVTIPDASYVSFGWWLRKDEQGAPSHVDVFAVLTGATGAATPLVTTLPVDGSAEYNGKAAGKFAILDNPKGYSNAGHFTADAMLTATFDAAASSLKGELTGFEANEEDVDWKVTLNKATWDGTDKFVTGGTTVWTVGGLDGDNAGMWEAQAFDENATDNSNVPTTVAGTFETQFGTSHKMSGAFGATK